MRLSDAMRLGAMLRPRQAFSWLLDPQGGTCALGAVAEALGGLDEETLTYREGWKAPKAWHSLVKRAVDCPMCGKHCVRLDDCIIHLNNDHKWTRDRIADFVQTLEEAEVDPARFTPSEEGKAIGSAESPSPYDAGIRRAVR